MSFNREENKEFTYSVKWICLYTKIPPLSSSAPFVLWKLEEISSSLLKMQVYLRDLTNTLHLDSGRGRGNNSNEVYFQSH